MIKQQCPYQEKRKLIEVLKYNFCLIIFEQTVSLKYKKDYSIIVIH